MIPWQSRELYVILSISLSAVMGVSLISPSLPVIQSVYQLSDVEAGYVITLYTLPAIFLAPLAGLLTDRLGRRPVLIPSLVLFGGAGAGIALTDSFTLLLILRLVQGVGSTSLALISRTLVGDVYEGRTQHAVMGLNDAALALGAALYPILGGVLAEVYWAYPFYLYLFPCLVALYAFVGLSPIPLEPTEKKRHYVKNGINLLFRKKILPLLVATLVAFILLYGAIQTVLPLHLSQAFDYPANTIGLFISGLALMIAVTSFFNGRLVLIASSRTLIKIGFGCYGVGLILIGLGHGMTVLPAGLAIFGIGHGLTLPSMNTGLVRSVETESRGALMSLRTILSRFGQTAGPFLFPLLGLVLTYPSLYLAIGLSTLLGLLLTVTVAGFGPREEH